MNDTLPFEMRAVVAWSPAAALRARIGAELADGSIPAACPHPVSAGCLTLPSRTLLCRECDAAAADVLDGRPGPCASCGAADACMWTTWLDEPAFVLCIARVCEDCGTSGTIPLSHN